MCFSTDRGLIRSPPQVRPVPSCVCICVCVPGVTCISEGAVAGDTLALPLVEGVQGVWVIARFPAASVQVAPLVEALQHVLPLCIRNLSIQQERKYISIVHFFNEWSKLGVRNTTLRGGLLSAPWGGEQAKMPLSFVSSSIYFCFVQV